MKSLAQVAARHPGFAERGRLAPPAPRASWRDEIVLAAVDLGVLTAGSVLVSLAGVLAGRWLG